MSYGRVKGATCGEPIPTRFRAIANDYEPAETVVSSDEPAAGASTKTLTGTRRSRNAERGTGSIPAEALAAFTARRRHRN